MEFVLAGDGYAEVKVGWDVSHRPKERGVWCGDAHYQLPTALPFAFNLGKKNGRYPKL